MKREIKERLREEYSFREYFIEKFTIDIERYKKCGEIYDKDTYSLLNNNNKFIFL